MEREIDHEEQRLDPELEGGLLAFFQRFSDDASCRAYLEKRRWPNGPVCPHCQNTGRIYKLEGKSHRRGLYKCGACRKQFTVTIGTIFEGSKIPLEKWFAAIYLMCASKKGISAHQIHRSLGITYKSAWFLCHRVRLAMATRAFQGALSGTVEADETYIGGRRPGKRGRGAAGKSIVFAVVEREGDVHAQRVPDVKKQTLHPIIHEKVEPGSRVMTDELRSYSGLQGRYEHGVVTHAREYVTGKDIHTNNGESFFALLKRGVHGTYHHIGHDKVDMYCGEFGFRFNTRKLSDPERFMDALTHCDGRLRWFFQGEPA